MANRVDNTNMLTQSRQNVHDIIDDKSNVKDPTTPSSQFRKWIYSREPDTKSNDFKGYPFIIVHPAVVDFGDSQTGNRQIQTVSWSVEVEVVSSDREFNNQQGKGLSHNDSISDNIIQILNSGTSRTTLGQNGLMFFKPNATGVVVEELDDTLVYRRSFLVTFNSKKKVF